MSLMKASKNLIKKIIIDYVPLAVAFCCILFFGIREKQSFIKMLPCLVSLFVVLLSANVNRISYLLGASNCILYAVGYIQESLYASVASAILLSMPIQVVTFFRWQKKKYKQATIIEKMARKQLWLTLASVVLLECIAYPIFHWLGGNYVLLDSITFAFSTVASILILLGMLEGAVLNMVSISIGFVMWLLLTLHNPASITYLIINIYNIYRSIQQTVNWMKLRKEQQKLKNSEKTETKEIATCCE